MECKKYVWIWEIKKHLTSDDAAKYRYIANKWHKMDSEEIENFYNDL